MKKPSATCAPPAGPIATIAELAALVDRDKGTVSRWLKRPDWPFPRHPPFQRGLVPKILRWVADTILQRDAGPAPAAGVDADSLAELRKDKLRKEIRKLLAHAESAETDLAQRRGRLLDAAEVEAEWARLAVTVRNGFQSLPSQLVPLALSHGMPREAAATFRDQVEQAVAGVLRRMSRGGGGEDESDQDQGSEDGRPGPGAVPAEPVPAGTTQPQ